MACFSGESSTSSGNFSAVSRASRARSAGVASARFTRSPAASPSSAIPKAALRSASLISCARRWVPHTGHMIPVGSVGGAAASAAGSFAFGGGAFFFPPFDPHVAHGSPFSANASAPALNSHS